MTEDKDKGNNLKLKSFLSLVRNKKNQQYSFVLKKRMFTAFDLTPKNILDMTIPKKTTKTTKPIKSIKIQK
jgi:hypothetical protein